MTKVKVIATGTPEKPLCFLKDNDGHSYLIPVDEEARFYAWVKYMESETDEEWEGHEYDHLGSHLSCYQIVGEVRL